MNHINDRALGTLLVFLLTLWVIHSIDTFWLHETLKHEGALLPQHWQRIHSIMTHSLLHRDYDHLLGNTIGLFSLGTLVILVSPHYFWRITWVTGIASGALLFLFDDPQRGVIGASGIVFGYFGYLLSAGIIHRRFVILMLSVLVLVLYYHHFYGMLPATAGERVAWEGHLSGFAIGLLLPFFTRTPVEGKTADHADWFEKRY
jgi:membrane associated rhomboid family serine protease